MLLEGGSEGIQQVGLIAEMLDVLQHPLTELRVLFEGGAHRSQGVDRKCAQISCLGCILSLGGLHMAEDISNCAGTTRWFIQQWILRSRVHSQ